MKSVNLALVLVCIICIVNAAEEPRPRPTGESGTHPKADQPKPIATENKDSHGTSDATVGDPHLGGFGYGSKTVYHKSYGGGFGGFGHHHGGGGYHHTHYSHSSGIHGGGFLRATQDQQEQPQQAFVGNAYGYASPPQIPCPLNAVLSCAPSVVPVPCSGGY